MSRGWWRRNRFPLIVTITLLPVAVAGVGAWEWWKASQQSAVLPVEVAEGETISFGGVTFGPASSDLGVPGPDADLPPNAQIVEVTVAVDRHGAATDCAVVVLRESGGAGREWDPDAFSVGADYRNHTLCPTDPASESFPDGPFTIEVPFVLPRGVEGPFEVDLVVLDQLPRFLRFDVGMP